MHRFRVKRNPPTSSVINIPTSVVNVPPLFSTQPSKPVTLIQELEDKIKEKKIDVENVIEQKETPVLEIPVPQNTPEQVDPVLRQEPKKSALKSTINDDVMDIWEIKQNDFLTYDVEIKELIGNELKNRETARFTIVPDTDKPMKFFDYSIISADNFLFSSHLENFDSNNANIIMNNISKKDVSFDIKYMALF